MYQRKIEYDRESRDYACYLKCGDGEYELVGFARTYHEAEVTLDQLVFELLSGQYFQQARPAEMAKATFVPSCDWGVFNNGSITTCACGKPAAILLHGVADLDIALCGTCHAAYERAAS